MAIPDVVDCFPEGTSDLLIAQWQSDTGTVSDFSRFPPFRGRMRLTRDLEVVQLTSYLVDEMRLACSPAGLNFPVSQFVECNQAFTLLRHPAPVPGDPNWDPDHRIWTLTALARLVRPLAIDTTFAARVIRSNDETQIIPCRHDSETFFLGWNPDLEDRAWFSEMDFYLLRRLAVHYRLIGDRLGDKVSYAFFLHDSAKRLPGPVRRLPLIASALEALEKTERHNATSQFTTRVPMLASAVGGAVSEDEADAFYDQRSSLAHGQRAEYFTRAANTQTNLLVKMERVLRKAVLRAILDGGFRLHFSSNERLRRFYGL